MAFWLECSYFGQYVTPSERASAKKPLIPGRGWGYSFVWAKYAHLQWVGFSAIFDHKWGLDFGFFGHNFFNFFLNFWSWFLQSSLELGCKKRTKITAPDLVMNRVRVLRSWSRTPTQFFWDFFPTPPPQVSMGSILFSVPHRVGEEERLFKT